MKVLMIQRAPCFSPNAVEKDKAILEAVACRLRLRGHEVAMLSEQELVPALLEGVQMVFTMGRQTATLRLLKSLQGVRVVNSPEGIEACARIRLKGVMETLGIPQPPEEENDGYWLKRGDAAAQQEDDVVYATDKSQLAAAIREMERRGISNYTVSAHVKGDLVKCYGVAGTGFFRYYYPTDDGISKFGHEALNGVACHYPFDAEAMRRDMERLATAIGVPVYGGDCIVRENGSYCIIDFNDWPSFSRCREEAAEAIVQMKN